MSNVLISENRKKAADAVAFILARDFDATRLAPDGMVVYIEMLNENGLAAHHAIAMLYGSARLLINGGRTQGMPEDEVRNIHMGNAHDCAIHGDRNGTMTLSRAVYALAAQHEDETDRDWNDLVVMIESYLDDHDHS